ncbi:GDSL-type esterase/lipase family protein [Sphingomonas sp. GB1N7]|uniref:GDSL-type esterase/lipase family protein n=1 Tax=Parasphingomonas caseinilytica TaxID=3096158 RepID=UPI002FC870FF
MRRLVFAAALIAAPALAQDSAPVGIVADPCIGVPFMPSSMIDYFRSLLAGKPMPPPAADMAAYKAAQDAMKGRDWADLCHYRADNRKVAKLPQWERRVVYMGDSITEAWRLADPEFFTGGRINRGVSGQTTAQMLLRFQGDVIALRPAMVHIMAGTNDIAGNTGPQRLEDVQNNIVAMVTLAKANHIRVVLASVPPALKFPWRPALAPEPQVRALNAWLKDYAARIGATYVDYHALLATPDGAMQPAMTLDGVHPNAKGYGAIKALSASVTAE